MRRELATLGDTLTKIAVSRAPINLQQIGDLLVQFARLYGRLCADREQWIATHRKGGVKP